MVRRASLSITAPSGLLISVGLYARISDIAPARVLAQSVKVSLHCALNICATADDAL